MTACLKRLACGLLLALGTLSLQAAAQTEDEESRLAPGQGALQRGDYAQAIESLKPLAAEDVAQAQFLLGMALEKAPAPLGQPAVALGGYQ